MSATTELLKQWLTDLQVFNQRLTDGEMTTDAINELSAMYQKMQPKFADLDNLSESDKALIEALQSELVEAFAKFQQMRDYLKQSHVQQDHAQQEVKQEDNEQPAEQQPKN